MQREGVVVSGVRTAIGDFGGSLKDIAPITVEAPYELQRIGGGQRIAAVFERI